MRATHVASLSPLLLIIASLALAGCGGVPSSGVSGDGPDSGGAPGAPGPGDGADAGSTVGPTNPGSSDAGSGVTSDAGPSKGGDSGAPNDSGAAEDAAPGIDAAVPFVPAPHPPFPLLVSGGGPVLTNPQVLPIFFSNYDLIPQMTQLVEGLPTATLANGDPYWSGSVSEYGVGALTVLPAVTVSEAAPTMDTDPAAFLQAQLSTAPFKNITPSTILAVFYPSTTPLGGSCAAMRPGWGGYHESFKNGSNDQPFAVVSECANYGPLTSAADMVSVAMSHEIIEAVTDPYPSGNGAYSGIDNSAAAFAMSIFLHGNDENGDMCTINAGFGRGPASFPFLMQRGWSNKAAMAGNLDPCSPDIRPAQPYVGAYPVMTDMVNVTGSTGPGVQIPVGQSKTIEVDLFSFEPTGDFDLLARQASDVIPPTLTFSWDKPSGKNGDKVHLTITSMTASSNGYEAFIIAASLPGTTDTQKPAWAGVVTH